MAGSFNGDSNGVLGDKTIVLVGSTGSGKSATGNSILERKAFKSMFSFRGVTSACTRQSTVLEDGRVLHVIDTPGLFDSSSKREDVEKEIGRCIEMAKDGIHALLLVVSLKVRFSEEQVATIETLKHLFGDRIVDYMIVVFTSGDELEEDETFDDYLSRTAPQGLKDILEKCGNRCVVFDNKTRDQKTKAEQRQKLLTLINTTLVKNGGKPYTNELFLQLQEETAERDSKKSKQEKALDEEQMQKRAASIVHEKLKERDEEVMAKLKQDVERLKREVQEHSKGQQSSRQETEDLRRQLAIANAKIQKTGGGERWKCLVM